MNTESSNPPPESSRNTSALSWLNQPVSMVENAKDTQTTDVAIGTILDEIKYGTDRRDVEVEHIRREYAHAIADGRHPKKAVASLKEALPGVQWSGQFSTRRADVPLEKKLIRYSCILCADIDDIQDRIAEIRAILSRCPFVFAIFLSPTGTGLKVLFRVPPDVAMHKRSFEAVRQLVLKLSGCEIDKACKDVTRLCFVSYDPELYLNASAEELLLSEYKNGTKKSERREVEDIRLHPESCIPTSLCSISLYNTPAEIVERRRIRNQAHERFEKDHPGLLKFYLQVVEDKFPAEPGARNKFLSEAVPFLF